MKRQRLCRICGTPETKAYWGFSNLTPYSGICQECVNRHLMTGEPIEVTSEKTSRDDGDEPDECPHCHSEFRAIECLEGDTWECYDCGETFTVRKEN